MGRTKQTARKSDGTTRFGPDKPWNVPKAVVKAEQNEDAKIRDRDQINDAIDQRYDRWPLAVPVGAITMDIMLQTRVHSSRKITERDLQDPWRVKQLWLVAEIHKIFVQHLNPLNRTVQRTIVPEIQKERIKSDIAKYEAEVDKLYERLKEAYNK